MALIFADRVQESTLTTGTGPLALGGAVPSFQSFNVAIGDTNTCYYCIITEDNQWEVGQGTFSSGPDTLSRDTVTDSSSGSIINLPSGNKTVFVTNIASNIATTLHNLVEDLAPVLGGELDTNDKHIIFKDALDVEQGRIGSLASTDGIFIAKSTDGVYNSNDGGIAAIPGTLELHGGVANVQSLSGGGERQVYVNDKGNMYAVAPPTPSWSVSDTDNGDYPLPNLGTWVKMTGLEVILPEDVAVGEPITQTANLHVTNDHNKKGGTINVSVGYNGAQPAGTGVNVAIAPNFDNIVPLSITSTTHGGLTAGDVVTVWVERFSQEGNGFNPEVHGSSGATHEFTVSDATGSGGGITDHTQLTSIGVNTHAQIDSHISSSTNPHAVTQTQVGLGSVDNTSDADKPVSTVTQTALDLKTDETDFLLHTGDANIHFTEASIDHLAIQNIGTNTHVQIDTHISDGTIHFSDAPADSQDYVRNNNAWNVASGGEPYVEINSTGTLPTATDTDSIAIGASASSSGGGAGIAIGQSATTTIVDCIAIGSNTNAAGYSSIAIGSSSKGNGNYNISIGKNCQSTGNKTVLIGKDLSTAASDEIIIGQTTNNFKLDAAGQFTVNSVPLVKTDTTETGTDQILNMVSLTQAEYDALTPVATTFYVIVG